MDWNSFIESFGGRAIILSALGGLFTFLITYRLNRHLEWYKTDLAKKLADLNASFAQLSNTQNAVLSNAFPERTKILTEVFTQCVALRGMVNAYQSSRVDAFQAHKGNPPNETILMKDIAEGEAEEQMGKFQTAKHTLINYYDNNQPYLSELTKFLDSFYTLTELAMLQMEMTFKAYPEVDFEKEKEIRMRIIAVENAVTGISEEVRMLNGVAFLTQMPHLAPKQETVTNP